MLADEAGDAAPVPERVAAEEPPVRLGSMGMPDDRVRDVPALPAGLGSSIGEVDLLAVEAVAVVEAAELVEHLAAQEQERAQHPVGLDRLLRPLVEQVVIPLALLRAEQAPQRRPAENRAGDGREAAPSRLPRAVGVQ